MGNAIPEGGLSPLAWGNPNNVTRSPKSTRSIPTRVGEPLAPRPSLTLRRVYPHSRGGTADRIQQLRRVKGLSPLAWGNRRWNTKGTILLGSIPTRVGEPESAAFCFMEARVYPHSRGGTSLSVGNAIPEGGLSPLAWGNPGEGLAVPRLAGSIPTRVGEPVFQRAQILSCGVYPHSRGGTPSMISATIPSRGLSPLAWGNQQEEE